MWRYHFTHVQYKRKSCSFKVLEIWSMTDKSFCNFGPFFAFSGGTNNLKKQNFEKMKKGLETSSFCVSQMMII